MPVHDWTRVAAGIFHHFHHDWITEIARALFGIDKLTGGEIRWKGRPVHFTGPEEAIRSGIAYLPENRKSDGLFFNLTGFPNMSMACCPNPIATKSGPDRVAASGAIQPPWLPPK